MNYCWTNEDSTFCLHGSPLSRVNDNNQKLNTKAYFNPQIVNYEFIKRSLSKNLQGGRKIHVNPNFKGNGLNTETIKNHPHLGNIVHLNSNNSAVNKSGTSDECNASGGEKCDKEFIATEGKNLNSAALIPHLSRFKKINSINVKNNESLYSWSKNKIERIDTNSQSKIFMTESRQLADQKSTSFNYKKDVYKYTSPEKRIIQTNKSTNNCLVYNSKTKFIKASKTELINNAFLKTKPHFTDKRMCGPIKKNLNMFKFVYNKNKKSSVLMVAKAVRSKYKYLNNLEQYKKSKYKIDKRNKLLETVKSKSNTIKDIRKLFPNYFYSKVKLSSYNIYNLDKCHVTKNKHSWRKNQPSEKSMKTVVNHTPNRRVVNIGGILYKSTANKLTLAKKQIEGSLKKRILSGSKGKKNHVVYVRGEKFILENNGRALRRQSRANEKTPILTPKRIDIGGVTYLQKSHNVLIRTNVHQARHFVNRAKNKSIALLAKLQNRSSMPCMIYHRFGRCIRHSKGLCIYKHDPKNISVCKKYIFSSRLLKGNCTDNNCRLSHQVIQEKMATCHFFLKGLCIRENCPFLHVKLNKNAAICEKFLQGFCNLGKNCSKRHLHQCPEFDKYGTCKLGSKCHYPHKKSLKNKSQKQEVKDFQNTGEADNQKESVQYHLKSDIQKKQKKAKKSAAKVKEITCAKVQKKTVKKKSFFLKNPVENDDTIECFPKRIKLDKLPCFIPLTSDS